MSDASLELRSSHVLLSLYGPVPLTRMAMTAFHGLCKRYGNKAVNHRLDRFAKRAFLRGARPDRQILNVRQIMAVLGGYEFDDLAKLAKVEAMLAAMGSPPGLPGR